MVTPIPIPDPIRISDPEKVAVTVVVAEVLRGLSGSFGLFCSIFISWEPLETRRVFPTRCAHLPFKTLIWLRLQARIHGKKYRHRYRYRYRYTEATTRWGHTFIWRHTFIAPARRLLSGPSSNRRVTDWWTDWRIDWLPDWRTDWEAGWQTDWLLTTALL